MTLAELAEDFIAQPALLLERLQGLGQQARTQCLYELGENGA